MDEGRSAATVALVGSFRRHFHEIQNAFDLFELAGWKVVSPTRSKILEHDVEFVRLSTDPVDAEDSTIQSIAMAKILAADVVFVIAPGGYIGKTTSYEIGRVIQAQRPIYFSAAPRDLPIEVHSERIVSAQALVRISKSAGWTSLHSNYASRTATLERGIFLESS